MGTLLHYTSLLKHDDIICMPYSGESVSHNNHSSA